MGAGISDTLTIIGVVGGVMGTLLGTITGLVAYIYRKQVSELKEDNAKIRIEFNEALNVEREARREAQDRLVVRIKEREDIERRIEDELKGQIRDIFMKLDTALKALYEDINEMRGEVLLMTGEVKALVKVCELRHKWDGNERRVKSDS